MRIISLIGNLLKWKIAAATLVGAIVVGGTGMALAFTPMGYDMSQVLVGSNHATATPAQMTGNKAADNTTTMTQGESQQNSNANTCPGDPEVQQLATKFSLSTDKNGGAMQVICALHTGTFQETVNGKSVTLDHPLGYGEIGQLLTYAQSLAAKKGDTLTNSNVQQYVATALSTCNTQSLVPCINSNGGQPTSTPTPHTSGKSTNTSSSHDHGKPTSTPTPPANK